MVGSLAFVPVPLTRDIVDLSRLADIHEASAALARQIRIHLGTDDLETGLAMFRVGWAMTEPDQLVCGDPDPQTALGWLVLHGEAV